MAELCGALGLVASALSVASTISTLMQTLATLRRQYNDADLAVDQLTSRLRIVRAALVQVQRWAEECRSRKTFHRELIPDLEDAVSSCGQSIKYLHMELSKLEWEQGRLKTGSKIALIFEGRTIKDFLEHLNGQITALNFLLTAAQCRTPNDQTQVLEKEKSKDVLKQAKDDTTSLVGFRDSASFASSTARNSTASRLSKVFDFDDILLQHKIYQNSFRSMLRRAVSPTNNLTDTKWPKPPSCGVLVPPLESTADESAKIDVKLKEDAHKRSREMKVLAIGENHGGASVIKQLRQRYGLPLSEIEVEKYRRSITAFVLRSLVAVLNYVHEFGTGLVSQVSREHENLIQEFAATEGSDWKVTAQIAAAAKHLWHNWHVKQAFAAMDHDLQTAYYLEAIERICQPDYVPTNMDIIKAPEATETIKETDLSMSSSKPPILLRFIEIKEERLMKILSQFADVQFCLFAIDLTCYDRYSKDGRGSNALSNRLSFLRSICSSIFLSNVVILLVFTNAIAFERKIAVSPLESHFEDYKGGNNAQAAIKYILRRCSKANTNALPLFWHIYDCAVEGAGAQATDRFFRRSADSLPAVMLLREVGYG